MFLVSLKHTMCFTLHKIHGYLNWLYYHKTTKNTVKQQKGIWPWLLCTLWSRWVENECVCVLT